MRELFKWTCLTSRQKLVLRKSANLCNDFLLFYVRIPSNMRNNQLFCLLLDKLKWWKLCLIIESIFIEVFGQKVINWMSFTSTEVEWHTEKPKPQRTRRNFHAAFFVFMQFWTVWNVISDLVSYLKDVGMFWCLRLEILDADELLLI